MKTVIHFIHERLKTQRGKGNYTKSGTGNAVVHSRHIRNLLSLTEITGAWLLSLEHLILKETLEPQASQPQGNNGARYNIILSIIYFVNICYYVSNTPDMVASSRMYTTDTVRSEAQSLRCQDSKPLMQNAEARTALNAWEENASR